MSSSCMAFSMPTYRGGSGVSLVFMRCWFYLIRVMSMPPRVGSCEYSYSLTIRLSRLRREMAACKAETEDISVYFATSEPPTGMESSVGLIAKCLIFFVV